MNLQVTQHKTIARMIVWMAALLLCTIVGAMPVQAATVIRTEADVLQAIREHPEVIIESLQAYETQQRENQAKAKNQLLQRLQENPQSLIGTSPKTGTEQKAVLVEFSDFQCPYCAAAHETVNQFMKAHQDQVALVYKHLPLVEIHPEATAAAKAAWAADQQGKFWQYHDALFEQQDRLGESLYLDVAKKLNLDLEKFNHDRQSDKADLAIQQDIDWAEKLGVQGTPFFVMNGKTFEGAVPLSVLEQSI